MIDTHVHVVGADRRRFPVQRFDHPGGEWVDQAPDASALLSRMATADVGAAVLVQPHGAYRTDNSYACAAAAEHPALAAVGIIDMTAPDRLDQLAQLVSAGASGLRLFSIPTPEPRWVDDPRTDDVWDLVAEAGLVMGVCVLPDEIAAVGRAAARHAKVPVVLDHCGFAPVHDETHEASARLMALAAHENVVLKVTTHVIDNWRDHGAPLDELFPTLVDRFGSSRLVWGSDFAQTHDRSYEALVALGRQALAPLSPTDREHIATTTPKHLWWPRP